MATRREAPVKEKRGVSPSFPRQLDASNRRKSLSPATTSSGDHRKDASSAVEKHIPNYLKPTISSGKQASVNNDTNDKFNRRKSLDRPVRSSSFSTTRTVSSLPRAAGKGSSVYTRSLTVKKNSGSQGTTAKKQNKKPDATQILSAGDDIEKPKADQEDKSSIPSHEGPVIPNETRELQVDLAKQEEESSEKKQESGTEDLVAEEDEEIAGSIQLEHNNPQEEEEGGNQHDGSSVDVEIQESKNQVLVEESSSSGNDRNVEKDNQEEGDHQSKQEERLEADQQKIKSEEEEKVAKEPEPEEAQFNAEEAIETACKEIEEVEIESDKPKEADGEESNAEAAKAEEAEQVEAEAEAGKAKEAEQVEAEAGKEAEQVEVEVEVEVANSGEEEPVKNAKPKEEKVEAGKAQGKKDTQAYNDVIEETANRLREKKNKVRALAGAFETVISLEKKPDS